jgi:hypothetical protein
VDKVKTATFDVNAPSRNPMARILAGEAGYAPLVAFPSVALTAVWLVMGAAGNGWDIGSLAIGLAWVAVAQVSLLAHVRRAERIPELCEEPQPWATARIDWTRRAAIGVLFLLVAAVVFSSVQRWLTLSVILVVLGVVAILFAAYTVGQWFLAGGPFHWSTLAIGLGGFGVAILQLSTANRAMTALSIAAASVAFGLAVAIWVAMFVRDLREIGA